MKNVLLVTLIAVLFGTGGFFLWKTLRQNNDLGAEVPGQTGSVTEEEIEIQFLPFPEEFLNDQDQDGLLDTEEAVLGTSDVEGDTDGDGITDFDEKNKWKTDPTKADTDGDGFNDLYEIINGYNPLGEGALTP